MGGNDGRCKMEDGRCGYRTGLLEGFDEAAVGILDAGEEGDGFAGNSGYARDAAEFDVDEDIGLLLRDIVEVDEHATAGYLVALNGIGDGNSGFSDEPYVTIHTAVIGEIELVLLLAGGIVLVIAVVGLHGNEALVACLHTFFCKVDGDGQITAEMLLDKPAIDIDPLLAHDRLKMNKYLFVCHVFRHCEVLAIPADTLIVAATTGLGGL